MTRILPTGLLSIMLPLMAYFGSFSTAQSQVAQNIVLHGTCETVTLADHEVKCKKNEIIYTNFKNGRISYSVTLSDGRMLSFVGEKDSQPQPEFYYLYLSRIRIFTKGTEFVSNVAGQCVTTMSRDGTVISQIDCNATDENRSLYTIKFRTDGARIVTNSEELDPKMISRVISKFKNAMSKSGIQGVNKDVQKCYDSTGTKDISAIRECMLYDISQFQFAFIIGKLFESRGQPNPNNGNSFLTERAFELRMQIYSAMAFNGSREAAFRFFGNAPTTIMEALSQ